MPDKIRDGTGKGFLVKVDADNRLHVNARAASLQHIVSEKDEQAYQALGTATLSAGTVTPLHITNTSSDLIMVVTYIRHQILATSGGTDFPNVSNYFSLRVSRSLVGGGVTTAPINLHVGSGNSADVVATENSPVLTGTIKEIDRWYTKEDGDMHLLNKEGSLIIGPNQHLELSYVGDKTAGLIYTRVSFIMEADK